MIWILLPVFSRLCYSISYIKNLNIFSGIATMTFSDDSLIPCYATYEFQLTHYKLFYDIPGDLQKYNIHYEQARILFSFTPAGIARRTLLYATFASNFLNTPFSRISGELQSPKSFFSLFNDGKRNGYDRMYNYAVTENGYFRISEVSNMVMRDMASKHAVLAMGSETVLSSGTLFIVSSNDDEQELVITNDSGTYAPSIESVYKLQMILETEIPGLRVRVMSHTDDKYKEISQQRLYNTIDSAGHALNRLNII